MWMHMCICAYVYMCSYLSLCVYVFTCLILYEFSSTCMCNSFSIWACIRLYMYVSNVCLYMCLYVYLFMSIFVNVSVCILVMCTCLFLYLCMCLCMCTCVCICASVCLYSFQCANTRMHTDCELQQGTIIWLSHLNEQQNSLFIVRLLHIYTTPNGVQRTVNLEQWTMGK